MVALASLTLHACGSMQSSFCPPDRLTNLPEQQFLVPCQPARCLLPDNFASLGTDSTSRLNAQADAVGTCHEADIRAFVVCSAKQQRLIDWIQARKVTK